MKVKNVKILNFKVHGDERGSLIALESHKNIPFEIKRVYYIYGTRTDIIRGRHAHRNLQQVMICINGSFELRLDDGKNTGQIVLDTPEIGVYIGNMVWREMLNFSSDCVILVLTDKYYNEKDYIRNYHEFLNEVRSREKR